MDFKKESKLLSDDLGDDWGFEDDEETNDTPLTFSQHFSKKSNTFLKNTNNQSKINIDKLSEEVE